MSVPAYEAIVVGSGFGGAVSACRLAARWPGEVLVLERGERYPRGSFARAPGDMASNLWSVGAGSTGATATARGLFELRQVGRMDVLGAAGLGGGSLIYANVLLEPPPVVFDDPRWPTSCDSAQLAPYYRVAKEVLGARPVPIDDGERRVRRTEVFASAAVRMGKVSRRTEVAVFFGDDPTSTLPPGAEATNRYGVRQTSCTYCAECDIGCNVHAKNTLDLNYLHRAEHAHRATVRTGRQVEQLVPTDADGAPDPAADGAHGYLVTSRDLDSGEVTEAWGRRVVVAAGTLGSVELLLRARDVTRTLPRLPSSLGKGFSGNGDFLMFVADVPQPTDATRGPVITQYIDHGLYDDPVPDGFVVEDAGYPTLLAWFVEGSKPSVFKARAVASTGRRVGGRLLRGRSGGRIGASVGGLLRHGVTERSAVLLCMGRDSSTGTLLLDRRGQLRGRWPRRDNVALYRAIQAAGSAFTRASGARAWFAVPSWWLPFRRNVTVHPLGGCRLADDPADGVVSADPATFGQVFGHPNLYVADGAIFPAAVGANPAATIAALAERVAEGITGLPPDADL